MSVFDQIAEAGRDPATHKQRGYIRSLCRELDAELPDDFEELTAKRASAVIEELKELELTRKMTPMRDQQTLIDLVDALCLMVEDEGDRGRALDLLIERNYVRTRAARCLGDLYRHLDRDAYILRRKS
jgi:hypothetical protein